MGNETQILQNNLVIDVTGCDENNLQSNVKAVIEGIKGAVGGILVNLQINLFTQNNVLQFQNLINSEGEENNQWKH